MLGELLGIRDQFFFKALIFFLAVTAPAGAGDRSHGDLAIFQSRQDLRGGAHNMKIIQIQKIHVGRRVHRAQGAVQGYRISIEGNRQVLRQHHLEDIAALDVFLTALYGIFEIFTGKRGAKIAFADGLGDRCGTAHRKARDLLDQLIQTITPRQPGIIGFGVGMNHDVQPAAQVIKDQ